MCCASHILHLAVLAILKTLGNNHNSIKYQDVAPEELTDNLLNEIKVDFGGIVLVTYAPPVTDITTDGTTFLALANTSISSGAATMAIVILMYNYKCF